MKCINHPAADSLAFCGFCGRALCAECRHEVRGAVYCENCLAARLNPSTLPPIIGQGPNPTLALCLGCIPGVGAIYNGQVEKAILQILIFGSLIAMKWRVEGFMHAVVGLAEFAFWFYMVIDSYQTARRRLLGLPAEEWFGLGNFRMNAQVGAGLLIGIGGLFLVDNLGIPVFSEISKFWPVLFIAVGVLMLQRRRAAQRSQPGGGPGAPEPPNPPEGAN